jgi:lysozyme family protein
MVEALCAARRKFVRAIKTYPTFGKGWERRISGIEAAALGVVLAAPGLVPAPAPLPDANVQSADMARATEEPKPASGAAVGTAVAAASGATATVINQTIQAPPQPLVDSVQNIGLWQQLGRQCAEFGKFVWASPVEVGVIVLLVAAVWLAPRALPLIWGRQT